MAQDGAQHLGVTPPLSNDPPKEIDVKLGDKLMEELKHQGNYEHPDETQKRLATLKYTTWERS